MTGSISTGDATATRSTCHGVAAPELGGRTMRSAATLLAMLWATLAAAAEPRILAVENAWNRADTLAVQANWSRRLDPGVIEAQARLAQAAEAGGLLTVYAARRVAPRVVAADVTLDDSREIWLWVECEDSRQWCYWGRRKVVRVGAAEQGQGLDIATTAVGVGMMGATEANPLGLGMLPLKVMLTRRTRSMAFSDCVSWRGGLDVMGHAPGAANVATLAAANPGLSIAVFLITAIARSSYAYDTAMYECAAYTLRSAVE